MAWLPPTIGFLLLVGSMGITIRLALRDTHWSSILMWATTVYGVVTFCIWLSGQLQLSFTLTGTFYSLLSGLGASVSFVLLSIALNRGDASQVVPVSSAYPIVTALLAAAILREAVSVGRMIGIGLVFVGLVVLARS